ncbi:MAG: NADH:ubiquinone reductase (Na(+)-transporting) subunit C [Saprospiraceae bacterium]|nr:NADH:ubiquinone reductase (Na(+)-transporting) subunit C [Saprospiraceae bacterium]
MHSTNYIIRFTIVMTVIVAFVLALMVSGLKDVHSENEAVYNKKGILSAVATQLGKDIPAMTNAEVQEVFNKQIEQKVINTRGEELSPEQVKAATGGVSSSAETLDLAKEAKKPEAEKLLPLFIYTDDDGKKYTIVYARGKGLWDEIWGYITLDSDMNTIVGQAFDHKGETPGLGAEIKDNKNWYGQFTGKKFYNTKGEYTSIAVVKGGVKDPAHQVDAISGATITGKGVDDMLRKGIKYYEPYFMKNKKTDVN